MVTRNELDDILAELRGDIQTHVDKPTKAMQASVTSSFATAVRKLDERHDMRFASLEADLSSALKSVGKLESENVAMWEVIRVLQKDLITAEASVPLRDALEVAADEHFDRKVDVTVIKVNTKELVAK